MPGTDNLGEFQISSDPAMKDAFKAALTSELRRIVKAAIAPIEVSIRHTETNISNKVSLLQAEFEKMSTTKTR